MYYFSIFRVFFKIRERVYIDNQFIFYFIKTIEERFKVKVCSFKNGICKECYLKDICIFPKYFFYDLWYKRPNLFITSPKYLMEELEEDKKFKIDFVMLNEGVDSFRIFLEAIQGVCKDPNFKNLIYKEVYGYNIFSDTLEKLDLLKPFPKYDINEFLNLRSGVRKIKIKIYPTFVDFKYSDEPSNDFIKFLLFSLFSERVKSLTGKDISLTHFLSELDFKVLNWKSFEYKDFMINNEIEKFDNHKFFKGEFLIEGDLSPIWYVFELVQTFSIGKLTNYGFGKVKIIKFEI
ncbi:MAG: hypothetical protein DSY66_02270 [Persephonella sp.]|nr:MAG: hypothetical protein DSY66_02270 [Persephonella sp.]